MFASGFLTYRQHIDNNKKQTTEDAQERSGLGILNPDMTP